MIQVCESIRKEETGPSVAPRWCSASAVECQRVKYGREVARAWVLSSATVWKWDLVRVQMAGETWKGGSSWMYVLEESWDQFREGGVI